MRNRITNKTPTPTYPPGSRGTREWNSTTTPTTRSPTISGRNARPTEVGLVIGLRWCS
jgi:hypothetical protein